MLKQTTILLACAIVPFISQAQLAITEVMASAANTQNGATITANSDFWELTNFGTNDLDLTGYKWNDNSGGVAGGDSLPFQGLIIHPGESILFFEAGGGTATEADFRAWWGLSPTVQVRSYTGNGLGNSGDGIRVWSPTATTDADVVDSVDFGTAIRGRSFVNNPTNGVFGLPSTNGVLGAYKAVTADDYGSPGTTAGSVPVTITQQPASQMVNAGENVTFTASAFGLPRVRYQWRYNGFDIPGATSNSYSVANVQTSSTGQYQVVVFNGVQTVPSSIATLTLNAAPEPPTITTNPVSQVIYAGQNATFTVAGTGVPQPTFYWSSNGTFVAIGSSFSVAAADLSASGTYSVLASNASGTVTAQATLTVTPRPNLVVTEVSAAQSTNGAASGHSDWWEVSNLGNFSVDLYGYKLDDSSATRATAYTITNHVNVAPGESVILVEGMSAQAFRNWWGSINLPSNLQIISYSGSGLGLGGSGDSVVLWNPGATSDSDFIAGASFGAATPGVTFGYNPDTGIFGGLSTLGEYGAFRSVESDDIGSPGYIRTPQQARFYSSVLSPGGMDVTFYGISGRSYAVEYKNDLSDASWSFLMNVTATGAITTVTLPTTGSPTGHRFYRFSLVP